MTSYDETYEELIKLINSKDTSYVSVNNVHTVTMASLQDDYRKILNESKLSLPDGKPLSIVARIKGEKRITRIFGPTFMEYVLERSAKDNISHFFFGSAPDTIDKLKDKIRMNYPDAIISGMISPPYKQFTDSENDEYLDIINNYKPDIVWVGLGAPKQEKWIYQNYKKMNSGVMVGIGAGFDYIAGNTKHAPDWMKNFALEWLFRVIQEPKRLWKRYLYTNTIFMVFVVLELLHLKKFDE